jgi:hypothetical protein
LVGVVVGALLFAAFAAHRERLARRSQAQRSALYELQEGALALRQALDRYGEAAKRYTIRGHTVVHVPADLTDAAEDATRRLNMFKGRILCDTVRQRVDNWLPVAEAFYTGAESVTLRDEEKAWQQLERDIEVEIRRFG